MAISLSLSRAAVLLRAAAEGVGYSAEGGQSAESRGSAEGGYSAEDLSCELVDAVDELTRLLRAQLATPQCAAP